MARCEKCGRVAVPSYDCPKCGDTYCQSHHLASHHDCSRAPESHGVAGPTSGSSGSTSSLGAYGSAFVESVSLLKPLLALFVLVAVGAGVVAFVDFSGSDTSNAAFETQGPDSDNDGLADERELAVGTDPNVSDTDGDLLKDGWEVRGRTPGGANLTGADPLHKDLYVVVSPGGDKQRPSNDSLAAAERIFAGLNVSNPDNETGITAHVRQGSRVEHVLEVNPGLQKVARDSPQVEAYQTLGPRTCIDHQVLVGERVGSAVGSGSSPGYQSTLVPERHLPGSEAYARVMTHELLHNLVGLLPADHPQTTDDGKHTKSGLLSHGKSDDQLNPVTRAELEDGGFASVDESYREIFCEAPGSRGIIERLRDRVSQLIPDRGLRFL